MSEQTKAPARQQAILDTAAVHLKQGDTDAYWKTIGQISHSYGKIIKRRVTGTDVPMQVRSVHAMSDRKIAGAR